MPKGITLSFIIAMLVRFTIKHLKTITLLMLGTWSITSFSQSDKLNETRVEQIQIIPESFNSGIDRNLLFINQYGLENATVINQTGKMAATVQQFGNQNDISATHYIMNGTVNLIQAGVANQFYGKATGARIENEILQQGEFNMVGQELYGNQIQHLIIQQGTHNEILQTTDGESSQIKVIQKGNDLKLIIRTKQN